MPLAGAIFIAKKGHFYNIFLKNIVPVLNNFCHHTSC